MQKIAYWIQDQNLLAIRKSLKIVQISAFHHCGELLQIKCLDCVAKYQLSIWQLFTNNRKHNKSESKSYSTLIDFLLKLYNTIFKKKKIHQILQMIHLLLQKVSFDIATKGYRSWKSNQVVEYFNSLRKMIIQPYRIHGLYINIFFQLWTQPNSSGISILWMITKRQSRF